VASTADHAAARKLAVGAREVAVVETASVRVARLPPSSSSLEGTQALTPDLADQFCNAQELHVNKLRSVLLSEHALTAPELAGLFAQPPVPRLRPARQTIMLSAVAPEVLP